MYLARDLIKQGHDVTLLTRGKSPITSQIPDDTDDSFKQYVDAVKHIATDRKDAGGVKEKLSSGGFEGEHRQSPSPFCCLGWGQAIRKPEMIEIISLSPIRVCTA